MIKCETELYAPLKAFFESRGFQVKGEVHACDLVASRGDEILIVEMKRVFNLELVFQAVDRQKLSANVYLAVEEPSGRARRRRRKMLKLCRMLGVGFITVSFPVKKRRAKANPRSAIRNPQFKAEARVDVVCDPAPYKSRVNSAKRTNLKKELEKRSGDFNTGGCTRRKIVTAYREEALRLAWQLKQCGPSLVRKLREAAQSPKAQSILRMNYYGWFERLGRGTYGLTASGEKALETYAAVIAPWCADSAPRVAV
jgi:hypothetical protein